MDYSTMEAGREMDKLIAENVMGLHISTDEHGRQSWRDSDDRYQHAVGRYDGYEDDEDFHTINWHPSESILWAWEVVEKLHLIIGESVGSDGSHWYCTNRWDEDDATVEVCADTAPLAICRAALMAVNT